MIRTIFLSIAAESNKHIACEIIEATNSDNKKPVLICIPSLGDVRSEYRRLQALLTTKGYTMVLMDHRGLGESDVKFNSYRPEDCGRDIVQLIDDANLQQRDVILIGNSYGGAAAVWAAAEHPERVKGVVLLDAFVRDHPFPFGMATLLGALMNSWTGPGFWTSYYKTLYTIKPSTVPDLDDYAAGLKRNFSQPGRMNAVKQQIFASKSACTKRMPEVASRNIPSLVIFGSKDPDFAAPDGPEKEAKWIVENLSTTGKSRYSMIEGCGHYPHVENPLQVADLIDDFVANSCT